MEIYGGAFLSFLGSFAALDGITFPSFFKQTSFAIKCTFKKNGSPGRSPEGKVWFPGSQSGRSFGENFVLSWEPVGAFLSFLGCFAALDGVTFPSFFKQTSFALKYTFRKPAVPEGFRKERGVSRKSIRKGTEDTFSL